MGLEHPNLIDVFEKGKKKPNLKTPNQLNPRLTQVLKWIILIAIKEGKKSAAVQLMLLIETISQAQLSPGNKKQ